MKKLPSKISCSIFVAIMLLAVTTVHAAPSLPPLNDPPTDDYLPGKFVWFDLATPAIDEQKTFYSAVFGWTFHAPGRSEDTYTLVRNSGRVIGGMFNFEPPGGEQDGAVWVVMMSVADPDETLKIVQTAGGSVDVQPATMSRRGRHALFRDPEGALFGVIRSDSGDPPDVEVEIGSFFWVDLYARDVDAMTRFYKALAPYEVEDREVAEGFSRKLLKAHGMARAGIVPVDEEANRSAWVPYVRVADVEATLEKVIAGGGFAIVPPDPQLLDGNVAVFVDPHGGVTGIVKWDYDGEATP